MFVAFDKNNNRLYADSAENVECFCQFCGEKVIPRVGKHNRPHFAHQPDSDCTYGNNKDAKSPWHRHMQDLFPRDAIEVRFSDSNGKLCHIADVYLKESKTVIEFQHSPISAEDFKSRTSFHVSEGRRIIWVFDISKKESPLGYLRELFLYKDFRHHVYYWPQAHGAVLSSVFGPSGEDQHQKISICLHLGSEGDIVRRIIRHDEEYKRIMLSIHRFDLEKLDSDDFFYDELRWINPSAWFEKMEEIQRIEKANSNAGNYNPKLPGRSIKNRQRL